MGVPDPGYAGGLDTIIKNYKSFVEAANRSAHSVVSANNAFCL